MAETPSRLGPRCRRRQTETRHRPLAPQPAGRAVLEVSSTKPAPPLVVANPLALELPPCGPASGRSLWPGRASRLASRDALVGRAGSYNSEEPLCPSPSPSCVPVHLRSRVREAATTTAHPRCGWTALRRLPSGIASRSRKRGSFNAPVSTSSRARKAATTPLRTWSPLAATAMRIGTSTDQLPHPRQRCTFSAYNDG